MGIIPAGALKQKVHLCCPQGTKQKGMRGIPVEDRCWPCRNNLRLCNDEAPCNVCIKEKRAYYEDNPVQGGEKFINYSSRGSTLNEVTPEGFEVFFLEDVPKLKDGDWTPRLHANGGHSHDR